MRKSIYLHFLCAVLVATIGCGWVFAVTCNAQDGNEHPIDQWLEKCIEEDCSTAGMRECSSLAYDKWDKELNQNYHDLMKQLTADTKPLLKNAQLQWIKFRDAESKLIDATEGRKSGTIWLTITDGHRLELVRKRALELNYYLDTMLRED